MRTLRDLINNPLTNPYTIDVLAPDAQAAATLGEKLETLPTVNGVISINSFVPNDQQQKLAVIADANTILAPTLAPHGSAAPVTAEEIRMAAKTALAQIDPALAKLPKDHPLASIAADLRRMQTAPDDVLMATNAALTRFLPTQLAHLRLALSAEPVTLNTIPPDFARDWLLPDGRARVQVNPKPEAQTPAGLKTFVQQVTAVAPDAGGSAVTIAATADTIVGAFRQAAIYAVIAIARDPAGSAAPRAGCSAGDGAVADVGDADAADRRAAAVAAQFRQYHRVAVAAGRRRLVQHLFRDELARRTASSVGQCDGSGDPVLGLDHRHGVRIAGVVGASGNREHGEAAADQPGMHAAGKPGLHPGSARQPDAGGERANHRAAVTTGTG